VDDGNAGLARRGVSARAKRAFARAGDQQGPCVTGPHLVESGSEVLQQACAECVQRLRPVERDESELVDARQVDCHPSQANISGLSSETSITTSAGMFARRAAMRIASAFGAS